LLIDDDELYAAFVARVLVRAGYTSVRVTTDPRTALQSFELVQPDIVLLDLHMPGVSGLEILSQLRTQAGEGFLPILMMVGDESRDLRQAALTAGATDFLNKADEPDEFLLRIGNFLQMRQMHCLLRQENVSLEESVRRRTHELNVAHREVAEKLAKAGEYRDDDTGEHTKRVGELAGDIATELGWSEADIELISSAAPLHDIGKIAISDLILLKAGPLTSSEMDLIRGHTVLGAEILANGTSDLLQMAESIALSHHEYWNGSGYPAGLKAEEIPIAGRIVAVADVFDALTHDRPYKKAWPLLEAVAEIRRLSGTQFDPAVVDAFEAVISCRSHRRLAA
jgi:putative two-component system response regulator